MNNGKSKNGGLRGDMTRVKKNISVQKKTLTEVCCQGRNTVVKTKGYNSLTANRPDNAGELRSREARTAPLVRHTSPALSGFFVRMHRRVGIS